MTALLCQDCRPDEIIVVDDGSTDGTQAVLGACAQHHPSVKVIAVARNEGVIAALNRGFAAARGRYVYFGAADDWVLPGFFRRAIERLEAHPEIALYCGEARLIDADTGRQIGVRPIVRPLGQAGVVQPEEVRELLRDSDNWIVTGAAVFRSDRLAWAGAFDEQLGSFSDGFVVRKVALTFGFAFDPVPVATWTISPDSVSRRTALDPVAAVRALRDLSAAIASDPVFPRWYPALFRRRWRFATARLALGSKPMKRSLLTATAVQTRLDGVVLTALCPRLGHVLGVRIGLAWLWLRLRPTSLTGVATTHWARARHLRGQRPSRSRLFERLPAAEPST